MDILKNLKKRKRARASHSVQGTMDAEFEATRWLSMEGCSDLPKLRQQRRQSLSEQAAGPKKPRPASQKGGCGDTDGGGFAKLPDRVSGGVNEWGAEFALLFKEAEKHGGGDVGGDVGGLRHAGMSTASIELTAIGRPQQFGDRTMGFANLPAAESTL